MGWADVRGSVLKRVSDCPGLVPRKEEPSKGQTGKRDVDLPAAVAAGGRHVDLSASRKLLSLLRQEKTPAPDRRCHGDDRSC